MGEILGPGDLDLKVAGTRGILGFLSGTTVGRFTNPYAVAIHGEAAGTGPGGGEAAGPARLAVSDTGTKVVHWMDLERGRHVVISTHSSKVPLIAPVGVAFDREGRLYVCDSAAALLLRYDSGGAFDSVLARGFSRPAGIAIDSDRGLIYVSDAVQHVVRVLTLNGENRGDLAAGFRFPTHLSVDDHGHVGVSDSLNFRAVVFDGAHESLTSVGGPGDARGNLQRPKGLAFDSRSHLYVVDSVFDNVQIFDRSGNLLLAFGSAGHEPGEFALPAGIAIDDRNLIYVADTYNGRVQIFRFLGGTDR